MIESALDRNDIRAAEDGLRHLKNLIMGFVDQHNRCGQELSTGADFAVEKYSMKAAKLAKDIEEKRGNQDNANRIGRLIETLETGVRMGGLGALAALMSAMTFLLRRPAF